jgi:hypothetical protein
MSLIRWWPLNMVVRYQLESVELHLHIEKITFRFASTTKRFDRKTGALSPRWEALKGASIRLISPQMHR